MPNALLQNNANRDYKISILFLYVSNWCNSNSRIFPWYQLHSILQYISRMFCFHEFFRIIKSKASWTTTQCFFFFFFFKKKIHFSCFVHFTNKVRILSKNECFERLVWVWLLKHPSVLTSLPVYRNSVLESLNANTSYET